MAYSVQTVLTDLAGVVHGTTVNKIPNVYGILSRAARAVLLDIDPKETQRIVQLSQVFNGVFDYALPSDVKGDRIVDLRPQAGRDPSDIFFQDYAQTFDSKKLLGLSNAVYTQWNTGVKTLRIEAPTLTSPVTVCDTSTILGWTATAGAQNLSLDSTNNVAGGGAIVFDLAAGSVTGSIQASTLPPVDLSGKANIDTEFYWLYLPSGAAVASVSLKWGSDYVSNYYSYTATTTQQGTSFQNGWNLIAAPWASSAKTGNPVLTAFDSVQLTLAYSGTLQTGLKFCSLTSNTGYVFEIQYYSKFLFRDPSTNAFQETVVDVTDNGKLINLDTETYNIYFNKVAFFTAQSLQGADAEYDAEYWDSEYASSLSRYKALSPSEAMKKGEVYYQTYSKSFNRFGNFRP